MIEQIIIKTNNGIFTINTFAKFGIELKHIRKRCEITQKEISCDLDISRATITNIEKGSGTLQNFIRIAEYLERKLSAHILSTIKQ